MHGTANSNSYFNHLPSSKIRSNQARGSVSSPMAIACTEGLYRKCSFCEFIPRQAILKCTGKRAARTSCKLPGIAKSAQNRTAHRHQLFTITALIASLDRTDSLSELSAQQVEIDLDSKRTAAELGHLKVNTDACARPSSHPNAMRPSRLPTF